MPTLKVGTRGSDLALFQTRFVMKELEKHGVHAKEEIIKTRGDQDHRPFTQLSGDGYFTKELERSLHEKTIHFAVHSSKDLPSLTHQDLPWKAVGEREDSHDVLITRPDAVLSDEPLRLKAGIRIGTSSPRRRHQLMATQPQVTIEELRGNVPTRVGKVESKDLDGVVLAKAGVKRLGLLENLESRGLIAIDLDWVASPCQGIIAAQAHTEKIEPLNAIANHKLNDIAKAEKSILALLGGGCHLPLGAQIEFIENEYRLSVFLGEESSSFQGSFAAKTCGEVLRKFIKHFVAAESGPRVWLTQPIQHALKPALILAKKGIQPVVWPLLEIAPSWSVEKLQSFSKIRNQYGAISFSSQFAAQFFFTELSLYFDVLDWLSSRAVFAVGPSTERTLREYGVKDVITPKEANSKSLARTIESTNFRGQLLVPGQAGSFLKKNLRAHGSMGLELYKVRSSQSALTLDIPEISEKDSLVLTSPSAAREFVLWCKRYSALKRLQVWAFGPSTSKELTFLGVAHKTNPVSGSWEALSQAGVQWTSQNR